jgi:hypothetical protein
VTSVEEIRQRVDNLVENGYEETASSGHDLLIQIARWSLGALIILLAATLLGFLFMRSFRGRRWPGHGSTPVDRGSVREEADVASDLAGLLRKLLPHWSNESSGQRTLRTAGRP